MKQPWVAALYMRLSNDDGEPGDSGSIETQRRILHQYCEDNNITIYDEYVEMLTPTLIQMHTPCTQTAP